MGTNVVTNSHTGRREETRKRIIDAYWKLQAEMPISQLKVRSIADAAGCSRTTFYQYFDSIYDLQEQAEEELIQEYVANAADRISSLRDTGSYTLNDLTTELMESFSERLSVLFIYSGSTSISLRLTDAMRPIYASLFELNAENPIDAFLIDTVTSYSEVTIVNWYRHGKPVPIQEVSAGVDALFTEWIMPHAYRYKQAAKAEAETPAPDEPHGSETAGVEQTCNDN